MNTLISRYRWFMVGVAGVGLALIGWRLAFPEPAATGGSTNLVRTTTNVIVAPIVESNTNEVERIRPIAAVEGKLQEAGFYRDPEQLARDEAAGKLFGKWAKTPADLLLELSREPEPYAAYVFPHLKKILQTEGRSWESYKAAAILYRYGYPEGNDYLHSILNSPAADLAATYAARTLATNQDEEALKPVLALLARQDPPDGGIIEALGQWHRADIREALAQLQQARPGRLGPLVALAMQDDREIIPVLQKVHETRQAFRNRTAESGAALVRLGALPAEPFAAEMLAIARERTSKDNSFVPEALWIAGEAASKSAATDLLRDFIPEYQTWAADYQKWAQAVESGQIENPYRSMPAHPAKAQTMMLAAASLLERWGNAESAPALRSVMEVVRNSKDDPALQQKLALALYSVAPQESPAFLSGLGFSQAQIQRLAQLKKLRPVAL